MQVFTACVVQCTWMRCRVCNAHAAGAPSSPLPWGGKALLCEPAELNPLLLSCVADGSAWVQQQMGQLSDVLNIVNTTAPALNNTLQMMAGLPL